MEFEVEEEEGVEGLEAWWDDDEEDVEEVGMVAVLALLLLLLPCIAAEELTVDSCSWISIMWSPRRIVRFRGALPDRKSTT